MNQRLMNQRFMKAQLGMKMIIVLLLSAWGLALEAQTRVLLGEAQSLAQQARQQGVARSPDASLWARAIAKAEEASRLEPTAPEVWLELGKLYSETRFWSKAETAWAEYLQRTQPNPSPEALRQASQVQFQLGYIAYQQADYERAQAKFQNAAEFNPQDAEPQRWLGRIALEQGNLSQARVHWQKAVALKPDATNRYFLSISQDMARFGPKAVRAFSEGYDAYANGQKESAFEAFAQASQAAVGWLEARRWLGRIALELGRTDQALTTWQTIVESPQATASDRYQLRSAELSARYGVEAAAAFLKGVSLFEGGNRQEARQHFEAATKATSGFAQAWYWLGRTAFEGQDYTAAEQAYAKVLEIEPSNKEAAYWLGQSQKAKR